MTKPSQKNSPASEPQQPIKSRPTVAQSLRPSDEHVLTAFIEGHPIARALVESWQFREPVTTMTKAELEEISERCNTTFTAGSE